MVSGNTVCEDHGRVVRAHAAVYADRIKTAGNRLSENPIEGIPGDRSVGHHEGKHRRHIRLDHPRPFGDAAQRNLLLPDDHFPGGDFGKPVRRHDRRLRIRNPAIMEPGRQPLHPAGDLSQRQAMANHAGGRHQNRFIGNPELPGGGTRNGHCVRKTIHPGRRVGNAAVGDHRLRHPGADPLHVEKDRRRLETVRRKHPRHRRRPRRKDERKILAAIRLDSCVYPVCEKSGNPMFIR